MSVRSISLAVMLSLALGSCHRENLPGELLESTHFRYHYRSDDAQVCEALPSLLESHLESIFGALGLNLRNAPVVDYYKFRDIDDFDANGACGEDIACAPGSSVRSGASVSYHDLIHAYLYSTGYPPPLLLEGTAAALSCESARRPSVDFDEAFAGRSASGYGAGAWLVAYLLTTYPASNFVRLYSSIGPTASADDFRAFFAVIYGKDLDTVWAAMLAAPNAPTFCPWDCSRPSVVLGPDGVSLRSTCGSVYESRTFSLPESESLMLTSASLGFYSIGSCEGLSTPDLAFDSTITAAVPLQAGKYRLRYLADSSQPLSLWATEVAGDPFGPACSPTPAPGGSVWSWTTPALALFIPASDTPWYATVGTPPSQKVAATYFGPEIRVVQICASCDLDHCTVLTLGTDQTLTLAPGNVLQIGAGNAVTLRLESR